MALRRSTTSSSRILVSVLSMMRCRSSLRVERSSVLRQSSMCVAVSWLLGSCCSGGTPRRAASTLHTRVAARSAVCVRVAFSLGVFMDSDKRNTIGLYCSQMASGFTAVSMPAGVGPAFVNLQFLRKSGYRSTAATAVMSAVWAVQGGTTIVLLLTIGLFTGRNTLSGMIPTNTLIMVIAIVALVVSAAMAIPPVRHLVTEKYLPVVKAYARNLVNVLARPKELALGIAGALVLNLATGLGFWAALMAFGYHTNPAETTFIFLLANTLGSAVPTPGGLGAVEAVLSVAFTAVGIPSSIAVSATLVYRIAFYWLRIPVGALAMKWLDMHNLI